MKIAVHLARNRRLLAWCVLSLVVHVLGVIWIDARVTPPAVPAQKLPLAVRLVAAAPRPAAPASAPLAAPAAAEPRPAPDPVTAPAPAPQAPAPLPASAAEAPAPALAQAQPQPDGGAAGGLLQAPGRFQVRPPPSARLTYAVTRTRPGGAIEAASSARLSWQREGGKYQLEINGILGEFESEGGEDDAGMSPLLASERSPTGGKYVTRFRREEERIEYFSGSTGLAQGAQDRASVLIQLAGIGLADPDQMQDVLEIVVADASGSAVTRFQVLGREELASPAGALSTVRVQQLARPGEPRLDIWLAPAHGWLPVQLRLTQADGTILNQQVSAIDMAAPGG